MRWFWKTRRDEFIESIKDEITFLRASSRLDRERVDRLTEALAAKSGIELMMPVEPRPVVPVRPAPNPWKDPNPVSVNFAVQGETKK